MATKSVTAGTPSELYMGNGLLPVAILEDSAGDLADHAARLSYIAACLQRVVGRTTEVAGDPVEIMEFASAGVELISHLAYQLNIATCEALRIERQDRAEFVDVPVLGQECQP